MLTKDQLIKNAIDELNNSPELRKFENSTGYKVDITTLTKVRAKVVEQKFYEVKPSDFMPVTVGDGAFFDEILTYRSFNTGEDFEAGIINAGTGKTRKSTNDVKVDSVKVPVVSWAKEIGYNLIELSRASQSGNWNLVEAKEKSRLKGWQLGIQKIAFLGSDSDSDVKGLLTQADVTINTTVIAKNISDMTAAEFKTFLTALLGAYFTNTGSTVLPDTFVLPTDDFLGLGAATDETYPLKSKLERITDSLRMMTGNPNFKVLPLAYCQTENNGLAKNRYALYRSGDEEALRMDIPVDYTTTIQDTINGFDYNSVAYGQFTGVKAYRPKEMIYFDHTA